MSKAVFHRLDRDLVVRRLRDHVARELATRAEVREVVLIGSLVRGDWSARSDADVVVVVDDDPEAFRARASRYLPLGVGAPVDVFVYTSEEMAEWSPRLRAEVERGLLLYRRARP